MQTSSRRTVLAGVAGAGVMPTALPGCLRQSGPDESGSSSDEPAVVSTYKYDTARTGVLATTPPIENARVKWSVEPDVEDAVAMAWPVVTDDVLYAGIQARDQASGALLALDAASGDERWRTQPGGPPTLADDTLYIGGEVITAHSADDGAEQWSADSAKRATAPAVVDGRVYGTGSGTVYAREMTDGSEAWTHEHGASRSSVVAVADDTVYVGQASPPDSGPRGVAALEATDGTGLWQSPITSVNVTPAVRDGVVYVPTNDGTVSALNASDGTVLWQNAPEGHTRKSPSSPSVMDDRLFLRTREKVYALDTDTGDTVWQKSAGDTSISALPVIGDRIAVPAAGAVSIRRVSDGSLDYEISIGDEGLVTGMAVIEGWMYVGSLASETFRIHAIGG